MMITEKEVRARIKSIEAYLKGANIDYPPQVDWANGKINILKYVLGEREFTHAIQYHNMLKDKRTGVWRAMSEFVTKEDMEYDQFE